MDFIWAVGAAVCLTAGCLIVFSWISHVRERQGFGEMAACTCPGCGHPIGFAAVQRGKDCSPFEELWEDGENEPVHHHPEERAVTCGLCNQMCVVRLNKEGDFFGPRISAKDATTH